MSFLGTYEHRRTSVHRPHLRMLRGGGLRPDREAPEHAPESDRELRAAPERSQILIAGADPARRAEVLADLTEALPADTQFGEAGAAWEVLEQAPASGVVMLAGDLDEVTAESLMNVLGHRHPSLPVVALGLFAERTPVRSGRFAQAASAAG
ncbi:MAG TPA: hypothetical protein VGL37_01760 [Solirubrobacteraceae bacterium]|jgi:hypothetical protein